MNSQQFTTPVEKKPKKTGALDTINAGAAKIRKELPHIKQSEAVAIASKNYRREKQPKKT
jgi:hypothetical protein